AASGHQDGLAHGEIELRFGRNRDAKERLILEMNEQHISGSEQVANLLLRHPWHDPDRSCADFRCERAQPDNLDTIPNQNELHARVSPLDKLCSAQNGVQSLGRPDRAGVHDIKPPGQPKGREIAAAGGLGLHLVGPVVDQFNLLRRDPALNKGPPKSRRLHNDAIGPMVHPSAQRSDKPQDRAIYEHSRGRKRVGPHVLDVVHERDAPHCSYKPSSKPDGQWRVISIENVRPLACKESVDGHRGSKRDIVDNSTYSRATVAWVERHPVDRNVIHDVAAKQFQSISRIKYAAGIIWKPSDHANVMALCPHQFREVDTLQDWFRLKPL